jgi:hypothetical protein
MQMQATALMGSTQVVATKKGEQQKARLKVMDIGVEASGGDVYWMDFWGEEALSEEELRQVLRQQVQIEVRRVSASTGKQPGGKAFLNLTGGATRLNGQIVQRALRAQASQAAQPRAS